MHPACSKRRRREARQAEPPGRWAPRPPEARRWRRGEGTPGEAAGGSPATLPSPQIVSRLGNSPPGPGKEQAVPTFFPQVAPAAFLRPFPQGPGRPSRETFAGRNLGGARARRRPCCRPRAGRGGCARPGGLRASADVCALVCHTVCLHPFVAGRSGRGCGCLCACTDKRLVCVLPFTRAAVPARVRAGQDTACVSQLCGSLFLGLGVFVCLCVRK